VPSWDTVRAVGRDLPEVAEATSYGTPALKVRGRLVTRLSDDGEFAVVKVDPAERAALVAGDPATFVVTPHYEAYPMVLVRLATVDPGELAELVTEAWRRSAPKRLVAAFDAAAGGGAPPGAGG
jgi:hypothetical protein